MDAPRSRPHAGVLALGFWLASRGILAKVSLVLAGVGALGSIVVASLSRGRPEAADLPAVASTAFAWLVGATLAFGASFQVVARDRSEGVLALARARGVSQGAYVRGRVGGLALLVGLAVGGATLVASFAATAVAEPHASALRASVAALVYAAVFAAMIAPLAMAALGGPTRAGGYFALLVVLVAPELLAPWTRALLPSGWHELTSIPAALDAIRAGVHRGGTSTVHALRAVVGLTAVALASLAVVHARLALGDALEPGDRTLDDREPA